MDRKERIEALDVALRAALDGFQSELWTALPAIVETFDASKMTITAKCALKMRVRSKDDQPPVPGAVLDKNNWWWAEVPKIVDVPVIFPSGGGFILTFPLFPGDPVLLVFSARCIDAHWQSGDVQIQSELRMHSLSDAFAFPGHRPLPSVPSSISEDSVQLRTDDGSIFLEITRDQKINIVAPEINLGQTLKQLVNESFLDLFKNHVHPIPTGETGIPTVPPDGTMLTQVMKAE